jgi:hypothetical protein
LRVVVVGQQNPQGLGVVEVVVRVDIKQQQVLL